MKNVRRVYAYVSLHKIFMEHLTQGLSVNKILNINISKLLQTCATSLIVIKSKGMAGVK